MLVTILRYAWASPNTLLGLGLALLARATGGGWQVHTGVVEAHGGAARWLLQHAPFVQGGAAAITFGHTVLAQTPHELDRTRVHERVHVEQYARWGPCFLPAYLLAGVWLALRGKDPYRDNPFEIPAYAVGDAAGPPQPPADDTPAC
ncbi:MAG: hypothetical protein ACIAXF_16945 [Phycisphaerales bacterium JB063]